MVSDFQDLYSIVENLVRRSEELSRSTDWKSTGEQLKALDIEWKNICQVPKEQQEKLFNRYKAAKDKFFEARGKAFDLLEKERQENLKKKEYLVCRAEEFSRSTDWKTTGDQFKALDIEWKNIGQVPKEQQEKLFNRYKAAKDKFFEARGKAFDLLEKERQENLKKKENLVRRAEELSRSTDWKSTGDQFKALDVEWKNIGQVPKEQQEKLFNRYKAAKDKFFEARGKAFDLLEKERQENLKKKEYLVCRAEELSRSTDWKSTGDQFKALDIEWKNIGQVPKEQQEKLFNRYKAAKDKFFEARGKAFDLLEKERQENLKKKENLVRRAEELSRSTDWKSTGDQFKALDIEWKNIGQVPKEQQEKLFNRYKAAKDKFFEARGKAFDLLEKERQENLKKKENLVRRAEEFSRSTDWKSTGDQFKALDNEWKNIGQVPKEQQEKLFSRYKAAKDKFFEARGKAFDLLEKERQENLKKKENLVRRAEELSRSTDWKSTGDQFKALDIEWKNIGQVPKEQQEKLFNRYKAAKDKFFEARGKAFDLLEKERQENLKKKENLVRRSEELSRSTDWKSTGDQFKALDIEWKNIGQVPKEQQEKLFNRYKAAKDKFFEARGKAFDLLEKERQENLKKKENLVRRSEELSRSTDWKSTGDQFKALDIEWKNIGQVPKEQQEKLFNRYKAAKDKFFEARGKAFDLLEKERQENLKKKENLVRRAEEFSRSTDWKSTGDQFKTLDIEWKSIGQVPKEQQEKVFSRYKAAKDKFFEARGKAAELKQIQWKQEQERRQLEYEIQREQRRFEQEQRQIEYENQRRLRQLEYEQQQREKRANDKNRMVERIDRLKEKQSRLHQQYERLDLKMRRLGNHLNEVSCYNEKKIMHGKNAEKKYEYLELERKTEELYRAYQEVGNQLAELAHQFYQRFG